MLGWSFRATCVGLGDPKNCLYVIRYFRPLFQQWNPFPAEEYTSWFEESSDDVPIIPEEEIPSDLRYSFTPRFVLTTRSY